MTLVYMVVGWVAGIALVSWQATLGVLWPIFAVGGLSVVMVMRRDIRLRQAGLLIVATGLGMLRMNLAQPHITSSDLASYNDTGYAEMIGVIDEMPDVRDNSLHLRVQMQSIKQGKQPEQPINGLALVSADRFGDFAYGDKLRIQGDPTTPPAFDTFSYRDYLARSGVYTFIPYSKITVLERGQGSPILSAMFDIRQRAHQLIVKLLPSPQSALLTGILLGINNDLPPEISSAFSQTGTSHIIAISGSNITIVAGLLFAVFGRLTNKRLAAVFMLIGIGVYTIFVGASPSVVRAAIMGALAIIALRAGRQADGLTALAASVGVMTAFNPLLLFDMGLILSAAATLGLILYSGPLTQLTERLITRLFAAETAKKVVGVLADAVLVTLSAQITTLPIIFLVFGQFSSVSFLVNILVIPAQASIMSLGILSVVAGLIWFPAGQLVAWLVGIPLAYTLAIIRAAANLPGAASSISLDPIEVAAYYVILFGVTAIVTQPKENRQALLGRIRQAATTPAVATLGLALAAIVWATALSRPDGRLHVWFLSVGQGNAVLIQSPNGAHMLIDGGENPTQLQTAVGDRLPFFKRDLDVLVITQPRSQTIAAIPPLLARYMPRSAVTNGQTGTDDTYQALVRALDQNKTQVITAVAGYKIKTDDGVTLEVISPARIPDDPKAKPGDAPLILRLTYHDASFLLCPDLTEKGMQNLLASDTYLQASVIELPSNGGEKQNPDELFDTVNPQVAVVEAEQGNRNAQPADKVLNRLRGIPVYRTDLQGTIEIATDGKQLFVSTQH